jgi:uncharacterized protein
MSSRPDASLPLSDTPRQTSGDLTSDALAIRRVIPDPALLVDTVAGFGTHVYSWIHGPQHWQTVSALGITLARQTPGADLPVTLLFGILHDALRVDDHRDPDHGRRAGFLARALNGGLFSLDPERLDLLERALSLHVDGLVSGDPTIGVCWDADRLHLWRIGIVPEPELLSTVAARARIAWAESQIHLWRSWAQVWALAGLDL